MWNIFILKYVLAVLGMSASRCLGIRLKAHELKGPDKKNRHIRKSTCTKRINIKMIKIVSCTICSFGVPPSSFFALSHIKKRREQRRRWLVDWGFRSREKLRDDEITADGEFLDGRRVVATSACWNQPCGQSPSVDTGITYRRKRRRRREWMITRNRPSCCHRQTHVEQGNSVLV